MRPKTDGTADPSGTKTGKNGKPFLHADYFSGLLKYQFYKRILTRIFYATAPDLMRQVVNRLYTFQIRFADPEFRAFVDRWLSVARKRDDPVLDPGLPGVSLTNAAD